MLENIFEFEKKIFCLPSERFDLYSTASIFTRAPEEPLNNKLSYKNRLINLPDPSGAVVFYSALKDHIKKTSSIIINLSLMSLVRYLYQLV